MSRHEVKIHKTQGIPEDSILLRLSIHLDSDEDIELYSENDRLSIFAHVLREYKKRSDKSSCTFSFGSFNPADAGGSVVSHLSKNESFSTLTIEFLSESEKGKITPHQNSAAVTQEATDEFIFQLDRLALSNAGTAIWKLQPGVIYGCDD
ncbi:hypothetical protein RBA41_24690 [Massilia sp. CCM 9210]|uniref:hypothetical protein n=1 Tax=Massilia scottii TaxID=3057166 RepID=UPI002796D373|nr:hypothetical protein [Massilia sp. CCM 9210]MDQ1816500.1 hypothetical protein [Massilia sp. CCM 9210]